MSEPEQGSQAIGTAEPTYEVTVTLTKEQFKLAEKHRLISYRHMGHATRTPLNDAVEEAIDAGRYIEVTA